MRSVAPPGDKNNSGVRTRRVIARAIQADRRRPGLWNKHADELRDEALRVIDIVKAKNAPALFEAGSRLDRGENCHLEYWYLGDRRPFQTSRSRRRCLVRRRNKKGLGAGLQCAAPRDPRLRCDPERVLPACSQPDQYRRNRRRGA